MFDLPEKDFSQKWRATIWEDRTGEWFSIQSSSDSMANLRKGARVRVSDGKISGISRHSDGHSSVTLDEVTFEVLPKIPGIFHWWLQYSSSIKDWLTSPFMFFAYVWWGWLLTMWVQGLLRVRRFNAVIYRLASTFKCENRPDQIL